MKISLKSKSGELLWHTYPPLQKYMLADEEETRSVRDVALQTDDENTMK